MLPMRFFRSRSFSAGNAAIFFAVASLFCGVFFPAQFLQVALGRGPLAAGLGLLPWTATLFFVAPVAGALVDRLGERPFLVLGPLLQAVGMGWLALIAEADMPYARLIAPLMVAGLGISMSLPAAQNAVVSAVPEDAIGKASGTNMTLRELGGVFGIAISVAFFGAVGGYASPTDFADGFVAAMAVSTVLSLMAAAAGLLLPARGRLGAPVPAGVDT
jgi:MFS family permease